MRLVLYYCPSEDVEKIGRLLIEKGLAASVNAVSGVRRMYLQNDDIHIQDGTMLMIQTLVLNLQELIEAIVELYPSITPAMISLKIIEGSQEYMVWVESHLKQ
jgi:periplasmic divalent cation tolerance protein